MEEIRQRCQAGADQHFDQGEFGEVGDRLAVAAISALAMNIFILIKEKKHADWIDSFSVAGSMLIAMICAVFLGKLM